MCGIVGVMRRNGAMPPSETLLRQMLAMIRHRGPDQFGIYLEGTFGMGNARLSIVDLDSGQQPIATSDGRLWIVYNGEVYNYRELRAELEGHGHRFTTQTDTEVVLHLYQAFGPDCLQRLNGQFAFAIWDALEKRLFLARDRLGIRPLFYAFSHGCLVFASEIKALACHPAIQLQIDPVAMGQLFTCWSVLPPGTVFQGIQQLPAGCYALAGADGLDIRRYWQLSFAPETAQRGMAAGQVCETALLEGLQEALVDATRARLHADVPVGAYLSGGLDSSIIAAMIRRQSGSRLDTFSISFTDQAFDESAFQRRMARFLGTEHQVVEATHADIGRVFPEVVWHTETPLLRAAPAPMFLLSKLVRENGYKVVLTGEGADEFLAGYDIFKEAKIRRFWARQPQSMARPQLLKRIYPDLDRLSKIGPRYLASFFGEGLADVEASDFSHAIRWRNTRRTQRFFSPDVLAAIRRHSVSMAKSVALPAGFTTWGALERSQYLEVATFLEPYLLSSQGDRVAMAHSVEGRYPFLDHRFVEFCTKLPATFKLRGLTDKYLLRKLGQAWLPADICKRPKKPYRAPIHRSFFNDQSPAYVKTLLASNHLSSVGLFNPSAVSQLVRKIECGMPLGETDDMALAGIISTLLVQHQFVDNFDKPGPLSASDDVKVCRPAARV